MHRQGSFGGTETMDIRALFSKAANSAAAFRQTAADRVQRPYRDYAGSLASFAEELPLRGSRMEQVLEELVIKAEPGLHMTTGPRFFAWVIGGSHPMGVAADMLVSAWGQNAGNHTAAPSAAAAEKVAAEWL